MSCRQKKVRRVARTGLWGVHVNALRGVHQRGAYHIHTRLSAHCADVHRHACTCVGSISRSRSRVHRELNVGLVVAAATRCPLLQ
jgi:hypothetical protein